MRDTALTALAGAMRRQGAGCDEILAALRETNKRCRPPHGENDLARIANSVARYAPEPHNFALTDTGNAEMYADAHGGEISYNRRYEHWHVWNGERWDGNRDDELTRRAFETARERGLAAYVNTKGE